MLYDKPGKPCLLAPPDQAIVICDRTIVISTVVLTVQILDLAVVQPKCNQLVLDLLRQCFSIASDIRPVTAVRIIHLCSMRGSARRIDMEADQDIRLLLLCIIHPRIQISSRITCPADRHIRIPRHIYGDAFIFFQFITAISGNLQSKILLIYIISDGAGIRTAMPRIKNDHKIVRLLGNRCRLSCPCLAASSHRRSLVLCRLDRFCKCIVLCYLSVIIKCKEGNLRLRAACTAGHRRSFRTFIYDGIRLRIACLIYAITDIQPYGAKVDLIRHPVHFRTHPYKTIDS